MSTSISAFAPHVINHWNSMLDPREEMQYQVPYPTTGPNYCTKCVGAARVLRYDLWVIKREHKGNPKGHLDSKCPYHLAKWFDWSRDNEPSRLTPQVLATERLLRTVWARVEADRIRSGHQRPSMVSA